MRREAGGLEGGMPVPSGEVVHVERRTTRRREQKPRVKGGGERVEGSGCATRERHPTAASLGLRLLYPSAGDNATDEDDASGAVNVPVLECEHDHRPVQKAELSHEPVDL